MIRLSNGAYYMAVLAVACVPFLTLTGCCPPAKIIKEPVEVRVSVPVPCLSKLPSKPVWAITNPAFTYKGLYPRTQTAIAELEQRRAYERSLEAAMLTCLDTGDSK